MNVEMMKVPKVPPPQSRFLSLLYLPLMPSLNQHYFSVLIIPPALQGSSLFASLQYLLFQLKLLDSYLIRLALGH